MGRSAKESAERGFFLHSVRGSGIPSSDGVQVNAILLPRRCREHYGSAVVDSGLRNLPFRRTGQLADTSLSANNGHRQSAMAQSLNSLVRAEMRTRPPQTVSLEGVRPRQPCSALERNPARRCCHCTLWQNYQECAQIPPASEMGYFRVANDQLSPENLKP